VAVHLITNTDHDHVLIQGLRVVVLHVMAHLGSTKLVTDNVVLVSDGLHIYIIKPNIYIYMLQCINGLS